MEDLKVLDTVIVDDAVKAMLPSWGLTLQEFGDVVIDAVNNGCFGAEDDVLAEDDKYTFHIHINNNVAEVKSAFLKNGKTQIL